MRKVAPEPRPRYRGASRRRVPTGRRSAKIQTDDDLNLLYGVPAIAKALGLSTRQVRHLADKGALPTFKIGTKIICARRSRLTAWLVSAEEEARDGQRS